MDVGIAKESDGAICIFNDAVKKKKEPPMIIRKKDGGFGYQSTDLATLKYRAHDLNADRIVYVTDIG